MADGTFSCRVCFHLQEPLVHIYEENLCDLLEKCGGIKVAQTDCYSKYLCKDCTSELLIAARFREKCERYLESLCSGKISTDFELLIEDSVKESLVEEVVDDDILPSHRYHADIQEAVFHEEIIEYEPVVDLERCEDNEFDETPPATDNVSLERQVFECDACGANFVQANNLRRHIEKSHGASEIYACEVCSHFFVSKVECERHCSKGNCYDKNEKKEIVMDNSKINLSSTERKRPNVHECSYCNKIMATAFALNAHIRIHTGECPFTCDVCGKAFKTQASLSVHLKRHAGMPDFYCVECGKRFYETSNLKVHMKTHTGERPHRCKVCGQTFARVFLLEIHTRIHTGEKPYKCDQCDRAFAQLCDLKYHQKTHTGERLYKCSICTKGFIKRNALLLHMQRHKVSNSTSVQNST